MKRAVLAVLATFILAGGAFAQHHGGPGGGGPGRGRDEGMGPGHLLVASDGTVFVQSDAGLKAISATGATLWTSATASLGHLTLSGGNLLSVSDSSTSTAVSSTITAIAASSGATAWTKTFDGRITELEAFSGGTYVMVVVPPATRGGDAARSLVALSNGGAVLWTVAL